MKRICVKSSFLFPLFAFIVEFMFSLKGISFMPLKKPNNQTDKIICRYKLVVSSSKVADHEGRGRKTLEEKATKNNDRE